MTPSFDTSSATPSNQVENPNLPRLLCLHGGGTNARIFRIQCRSVIRIFAPHFHLVFVEAPFPCDVPGPDVLSVYASYGPFKRWLRFRPEHEAAANEEVVAAIEGSMREAMAEDDAAGWTGEWAGLLGFSQGAKVAASVLYELHLQMEENVAKRVVLGGTTSLGGTKGFAGANWRFGVLLAGRGPLVGLSPKAYGLAGMDKPGGMAAAPEPGQYFWNQNRIALPTVQVHGLSDPGLKFHRVLLEDFTEPGTAEVLEWDGNHRIAIKTADVTPILQATLRALTVSPEYLSRYLQNC